jgi:MFS transporter, DHA2 family, multidrug resistance protein
MTETQAWTPRVNPWIIALTVTLATFMEVLDTSIANVALPHIAGGLSAGEDEATWVLTSYLVSNAIVLPLSGWLSNLFGRKRFYMTCVAIFTASSFLCGLAPNLSFLIFLRILQGMGGGGLQPSEQAILADTFPPAKRGMAFAFYGFAVVAAPAIGPTLGGWITDNYTWRWIFLINVPIGILSLFLTSRLVEDPPYLRGRSRAGIKIDYIGFALLVVGLGLLQVVMDKGQREDWFESNFILVSTIVSLTCLVAVVIWELRQKDPIVDFGLLRERNFGTASFMMFMLGLVLFGSTVLLPQLMQTLLGYSAKDAGMAISPGGFVIMAFMPLVGYLVSRMDARLLIAFGLAVTSWALYHMSKFSLNMNFGALAYARAYQAMGIAFLFVPINTVAYAFMPANKSNAVSALINLGRNVGGSVGISLVTTLLARRTQVHQSMMIGNLNPYNDHFRQALQGTKQVFAAAGSSPSTASAQAYARLYGLVQRQSAMLAYIDCFLFLALLFAGLIPFVFIMRKVESHKGAPPAH